MKLLTNEIIRKIRGLETKEVDIDQISDPIDNPYAFRNRDMADKDTFKDHLLDQELLHPLVVVQQSSADNTYILALGKRRYLTLKEAAKTKVPCKIIEAWKITDASLDEIKIALRNITIIESAFNKPHSDESLFDHFCNLRSSFPTNAENSKETWTELRKTFGITRDHERYRTIKRMYDASAHDSVRYLYDQKLLSISHISNERLIGLIIDVELDAFENQLEILQAKVQDAKSAEGTPLCELSVPAKDLIDIASQMLIGPTDSSRKLEEPKANPRFPSIGPVSDDNTEKLSIKGYDLDLNNTDLQEVLDLYWHSKCLYEQLKVLLKSRSSNNFRFEKAQYGRDYVNEANAFDALEFANFERVFDDLSICTKATRDSFKEHLDNDNLKYRKELFQRLVKHCEDNGILKK